MAQQVPEKFGKCKVLRRIGRGATAVVYLAKHEGLDMPVAVKVLRRQLSQRKPQYAERFLREARMAAWLQHPNIVRVIDCGVEGGFHYMVMDYVDGPNCRQQVRDHKRGLHWREAAEIVRQASVGLAYAAARDVIHRDVKPSNIMIESSGRIRVTDLGLAKLSIKGMADLTQELHTVGTPNYMSPEQIQSLPDLDLRSDVYALGATFYHLVTGRPPFLGSTAMEVIAQHLSSPLVPPREIRSSLPREVSSIICKMMAKQRDERYQTYEAVIEDVEKVLEGREPVAEGFRDVGAGIEDEDELRRVLDELSFAAALKIEDEEETESVTDETGLGLDEERSTSEIDLFGPEDFASYREEDAEERQQAESAKALQQRREQTTGIVLALIVIGVIALIVVVVLAATSSP